MTNEEFVKQIVAEELKLALKKLPYNNPEKIMENMSHRIVKKILHPFTDYLNDREIFNLDSEQSKKDYTENYFSKFNRPADHVSFDK